MASNQVINSAYAATQDYHLSIPQTPQTIVIPPASLGDRYTEVFSLAPPADHEFEVGEFVSPNFFTHVNSAWFSHQSSGGAWTYAMRREAQQILPFLYLGPSAMSKDQGFLRREGITLLLSIRDKRSGLARLMSGAKAAEDLGIQSDSIDIDGDSDLIAHFPQAIRRINHHLVAGPPAQQGLPPKVLVFCEAGNERSASVVMAYLMVMFNLDMPTAMWTVQHRRFCVSVDESVQNLLLSFGTILEAKRQVTKARRTEDAASDNFSRLFPENRANKIVRKRSFVDHLDVSALDTNGGMVGETMAEAEDNSEHVKQKPSPFVDRVN
ncbi:hypothetical protein PISL3812_06698 [Talaromyces islandicus]|uniref:Tyrosine specific protein phosphatases domain-containing protein n=1 Tax=Talaromyces islandicus TaxID=28573 RepID=A0A0U1M282_TALIS|nr:hypothetical protein PISL3812_06698 [Talaromyces islandicus]